MEAHEALVAGVLGVAALYSARERGDGVDRTLALVALWVCATGILGVLLAQLGDGWRYVRLALRLTGPALLLVVCEESVRTSSYGGSRKNSIVFAGLIWALAVGALVYRGGRAIVDVSLEPVGYPLQMGVTSWMAILAICGVGALLTVAPALVKRINPGFAGIAALLLLLSEAWAAVDPRWGTGSVGPVTYRTLLTLALAAIAVYKARSEAFELSMSAGGAAPRESSSKGSDSDGMAREDGDAEKKDAPPTSSSKAKSGSKASSKGSKGKKRKR